MLRNVLLIFCLGFTVTGCGGSVITHPSPVSDLALPGTTLPYRIGAGDEIEVKFFITPELNDRIQVRPDGKISLMFLQDVQAAGKTSEELAAALKQQLSAHLKQPDLVVIVRTFGSQKVFVGGEVVKPGPVQLSAQENLVQVLDEAGWLNSNARLDEIILVRRKADGTDGVYPLNVEAVLNGEDVSQNVPVEAGDIILVPPSASVVTDRWVDQNMRQILPFNTAVYYDISNNLPGR